MGLRCNLTHILALVEGPSSFHILILVFRTPPKVLNCLHLHEFLQIFKVDQLAEQVTDGLDFVRILQMDSLLDIIPGVNQCSEDIAVLVENMFWYKENCGVLGQVSFDISISPNGTHEEIFNHIM